MFTLALTGDVMLGRGVNEALHHLRPEEPWGDTLPLLLAADLRVINLECALTASTRPWMRTPKVFHFRANPAAVRVLQAARIDACALANNHTLDYEETGLLDTLACLDATGIGHAGAGKDAAAAAQPCLLPGTLALLSFTANEPDWAAGPDHPGINYLPTSLAPAVLDRVSAASTTARAAGAETILFSNHWGPNMLLRPSVLFQEFAHAVLDLGADIYYGHSAHLVQGIEIYRGKPILYDTGDYLDDYAIDPDLHNDWSFLFSVSLENRVLRRLELFPVTLTYARVQRAVGTGREAMLARMEALSAEFGTALVRREDHLLFEPPPSG
ncbi:MAG TPA: CapA family protein [Armatimonadota bacterium]|nr:CapA family protein [Armatimonadota bacterium]